MAKYSDQSFQNGVTDFEPQNIFMFCFIYKMLNLFRSQNTVTNPSFESHIQYTTITFYLSNPPTNKTNKNVKLNKQILK